LLLVLDLLADGVLLLLVGCTPRSPSAGTGTQRSHSKSGPCGGRPRDGDTRLVMMSSQVRYGQPRPHLSVSAEHVNIANRVSTPGQPAFLKCSTLKLRVSKAIRSLVAKLNQGPTSKRVCKRTHGSADLTRSYNGFSFCPIQPAGPVSDCSFHASGFTADRFVRLAAAWTAAQ
jgi:hypothetical protein